MQGRFQIAALKRERNRGGGDVANATQFEGQNRIQAANQIRGDVGGGGEHDLVGPQASAIVQIDLVAIEHAIDGDDFAIEQNCLRLEAGDQSIDELFQTAAQRHEHGGGLRFGTAGNRIASLGAISFENAA